MSAPLVYVTVLNFKGEKDTIECVESLKQQDYDNLEILIIDNDSKDGSAEHLRAHFSEIKLIETGYNFGYAKGNNIGIEEAVKNGADYVLVLNNDTTLEPDCVRRLVEAMESYQDIALIGPAVYEYFNHEVLTSIGAFMNLKKGEGSFATLTQAKDGLVDCDYVPGCAIMVRCALLEKIGLIPDAYFMFFEETEWCFKAKRAGYRICGCRDAVIYHKESASMQDMSEFKTHFLGYNR
ncbi:MAG: glycosyltransferase family 2 protein, partial [Pseudobutyrivibrio sp.]|nr:glycosyltransferase family 2 protein [Pseudobutyrivibrio sp.]